MMKKILKLIYQKIPFKKEFYSALKQFWKPNSNIYKHLHFTGEFDVKVDDKHYFKLYHTGSEIENIIFWEGLYNNWEKETLKIWIKLCQKSEIIFDIGANTGVYALLAKSVNPQSKVFAFEPHQKFFPFLVKNNDINSYDIHCIPKAISNHNGEVTLDDYSLYGNKIVFEYITLDTFIEQHQLSKIDLMKIDVEKHEPQVLEGFQKYLREFKPTMIIEVLNQEVANKMNYYLNGLDYLYFNIDDKKGTIRQTDVIEKSDFWNYLVCNYENAKYLSLID